MIDTNPYVVKANGITLSLLLWEDATQGVCLACVLPNHWRAWRAVHDIYIHIKARIACYTHNCCTTVLDCVHAKSFLICSSFTLTKPMLPLLLKRSGGIRLNRSNEKRPHILLPSLNSLIRPVTVCTTIYILDWMSTNALAHLRGWIL